MPTSCLGREGRWRGPRCFRPKRGAWREAERVRVARPLVQEAGMKFCEGRLAGLDTGRLAGENRLEPLLVGETVASEGVEMSQARLLLGTRARRMVPFAAALV